jgi:hypothetical protein
VRDVSHREFEASGPSPSSSPIEGEGHQQGDTSCRGLGCPQSLFSGLKARMETGLKGAERMVAGGHSPPYGYCWIPASAGMTLRWYLPRASLKLAPTRIPKGCAEGQSPFAEGLGVPPNFPFSPQEWGPGVENKLWDTLLVPARSGLPAPKRNRGQSVSYRRQHFEQT